MASLSIRGKEATVVLTVAGRKISMRTKNFKATPNMEIKKDGYVGQRVPEGNPSFNGYDLSWDVDEEDGVAIDLHTQIVAAEQAGTAPPVANITVLYRYRKTGERRRAEVYPEVVLAVGEGSVPGQDENVMRSFSGYAKKRDPLTL